MPETATTQSSESKEELIPKAEFDKTLQEKETALASLKAELEQKELQLLDPEYLQYRENKAKQQSKPKPTKSSEKGSDLDDLRAEIEELRGATQSQQTLINQLLVDRELTEVRRMYKDFDDYKADIEAILKNSPNELNFEQAYLIARSRSVKEQAKETPKARMGSEKPSASSPVQTLEKKEFKNKDEADAATIAALRDKYPGLGDTI